MGIIALTVNCILVFLSVLAAIDAPTKISRIIWTLSTCVFIVFTGICLSIVINL